VAKEKEAVAVAAGVEEEKGKGSGSSGERAEPVAKSAKAKELIARVLAAKEASKT
jgi:hypothetical protein